MDQLAKKILVSINKKIETTEYHVLKSTTFDEILLKISNAVYQHEGKNDDIVEREVIKYVLKNPKAFLSRKKEFINISKEIKTKKIELNEEGESCDIKQVVSVEILNIFFDRISDYNVSNFNNELIFQEIVNDKGLLSPEIVCSVDPGNYSLEELLYELRTIMTENSKTGTNYYSIFNKITSKISFFSLNNSQKLSIDVSVPIRKQIRDASINSRKFNIKQSEKSILGCLGFKEVEESKSLHTASSICNLYKNKFMNVVLLANDKKLISVLPVQTDELLEFFPNKNKIFFEKPETLNNLKIILPSTESPDSKFKANLIIEYI